MKIQEVNKVEKVRELIKEVYIEIGARDFSKNVEEKRIGLFCKLAAARMILGDIEYLE